MEQFDSCCNVSLAYAHDLCLLERKIIVSIVNKMPHNKEK